MVGASGGSLYLIDPTSGEERWRWEPGFHPSGVTLPPAVDGRQAVVVTNAGYVTSFIVPETREGPLSFGAVGWYEEP